MATVQIDSIDRHFAGLRTDLQRSVDLLVAWWRAVEPALRQLAAMVNQLRRAQRADLRRMHTDYHRRLRARQRRRR